MLKWVKKQFVSLVVAMSRVEHAALGSDSEAGDMGIDKVQRHKQGYLSDALERGEITQEVKNLRWRMYKVLQATDGVSAEIVGYDDEGFPIVKMKESRRRPMRDVKIDSEDDYEPIMVVDNSEVMLSTDNATDTESIKEVNGEEREDESGNKVKTIAEIGFDEYYSNVKPTRPINVIRDYKPKFEIEKYTKRLVVRMIKGDERLLEFYVSMYPDEFDRKTRLLISEIKKAQANPRVCDMLDIKEVNYITDKTIGALDYHLYEYQITGFDKIVEFDGNYIIKFKAKVTTDGLNILEKYREKELDDKYERKQAK